MQRRTLQLGSLLQAGLLVLTLAASAGAAGQRTRILPPRPPADAKPPTLAQERRMLDLPPRWIDRVQQMAPAEQERFLANNERFRSLPPERRAQIRRQLQVWNNLAPEQRQAVQERQQVWERMTPQQQNYVRDTLLPRWQALPPGRRQVVLQRLHDLRGMDDSQRAEKLNDDGFVGGLSPDERQMLRDLSTLRVNGPEPPGM